MGYTSGLVYFSETPCPLHARTKQIDELAACAVPLAEGRLPADPLLSSAKVERKDILALDGEENEEEGIGRSKEMMNNNRQFQDNISNSWEW